MKMGNFNPLYTRHLKEKCFFSMLLMLMHTGMINLQRSDEKKSVSKILTPSKNAYLKIMSARMSGRNRIN